MGFRHTTSKVAAIILVVAAIFAMHGLSQAQDNEEAVRQHVVEIRDFGFSQLADPVKPGDIVTWFNADLVPHTATAIDESWDTGNIPPGEMKSVVIVGSAMDSYYCRFHPTMKSALPLDGLQAK